MQRLLAAVFMGAFVAVSLAASVAERRSLEELSIDVPDGWKLTQESTEIDTHFLTFEKGESTIRLYAAKAGRWLDRNETQFLSEGTVTVNRSNWKNANGVDWETRLIRHEIFFRDTTEYQSSTLFSVEGDRSYLVVVQAPAEFLSERMGKDFLNSARLNRGGARSLTEGFYHGKKYYVGWGAAMPQDEFSMHNEVKYDVRHTHDIFTKAIGGNYIGTTLFGREASASRIRNVWSTLADKMTWQDMFIQYSSGHGSKTGLQVGLTYNEIRDRILELPAKEIIVFTMACHSGGLVNAFNQKKSVWNGWSKYGRTLMVMASSRHVQLSSGGPGTDSDEPGGPKGSAGSAFGHALWKALIGYADGAVDGIRDGLISLEEIEKYTKRRTQQLGGHSPVTTGNYSGKLIMNRVPSRDQLRVLEQGSSESLSDAEIEDRIMALEEDLHL